MTMTNIPVGGLLGQLDQLGEAQLCRLLVEHLTKWKLGLNWEANAIERDAALSAPSVSAGLFRVIAVDYEFQAILPICNSTR